jgi:arsenical pump membrane protein
LSAAHAHAAFSQAWPAFALVAGLLLIGAVAAQENLFVSAGALVARAPGGPFTLLAGLLLVEAAITALLNLDTAVVFMTPVLLHAARHRGVAEDAFLYGAVFMANAASLLLPGSNLTNLIVLAHEHISGVTFAARLAGAWVVSIVLTIVFVALVFRRGLAAGGPRGGDEVPRFRPGLGSAGVVAAAALVLFLSQPALPVLALGAAIALSARLGAVRALRAANPALLLGVLGVAVLLGTVARAVDVNILEHAGRWETAWLAAGASVLVNNLPAAVVLSVHLPAHPRALLLGLDLGPNLAVTGSLSAVLWLQVARANDARPSIARYTLLGLALVPVTLTAALLVSSV